ncbi:MAG: hypothetical protein J6P58_06475 [Oscillospiraceae bacterium]|nr:hypothetical protein [Oscillospiraceae bacterium]
MAEKQRCVALRVPGTPDSAAAEALVRSALSGRESWGALEIEIFPGRESTLLLAHPADGVYITKEALRFLLRPRED